MLFLLYVVYFECVLSGSLQSLDLALSRIQFSIAFHTRIILIKTILSILTISYSYILQVSSHQHGQQHAGEGNPASVQENQYSYGVL